MPSSRFRNIRRALSKLRAHCPNGYGDYAFSKHPQLPQKTYNVKNVSVLPPPNSPMGYEESPVISSMSLLT